MTMNAHSDAHESEYLSEAVRLACANVGEGGGPFGAVVIRDGLPLATGVNLVVPHLDPTAHAEVVAIRRACRAAGTFALRGCTLYSSCEPCPMCLAAAMWARVDRVVHCATREDAAAAGFDDLRWYEELDRPPEQRAMPIVRVPLPASTDPFRAWLMKHDRQRY
jgi:guanine deaminase